LTLYIVF